MSAPERSEEERRQLFKDIRDEARKSLRKLDRAEELVRPHYEAALFSGKRTRHSWAFVVEILRDKRSSLEMLVKNYRIKKKPKP